MAHWFLLILLLLTGCSDHPNQEAEIQSREEQTGSSLDQTLVQVPPQVQDRIRTDFVTIRVVPQTVTVPGEVALDLTRVAEVASRISGQVERVFVQLGDRVQEGQPLAAIGSLKLDELVQEFLVSRVQIMVSKTNFLRTKKLLEQQVVSQRRFLEDQAQYLKDNAVYQHVTEKLRNMGLSTSELQDLIQGSHTHGHHYLLKAPLAGILTSQKVVLGQGVLPGRKLFQIVDTSRVWVFANVPIEQVRRFKRGNQGIIVPKGREPIKTVIAYIAPVADKATLTVRLRFDVENQDRLLKPNEYVEVRLIEEASPALLIPRSAVTLVEGSQGVFVQRQNGFAFVPVELGREGDDWFEVLIGVAEGDQVVTKGVFDLKNALLKDTIQAE